MEQLFNAQGKASYIAWFEWFVPATVQGKIDGISAGKVVLGEQSPFQPGLASLNGRLYLAWRGDGNDQLNISVSFDNGRSFVNKWVGGDTSTAAPALCANAGSLFLSRKGDGNDNINVAQVALNANGAPTGLINKVTLGDQTPTSPALASLDNVLYLAWKGDGNDNLNVISSDDGRNFGGKITSGETSPYTPALVANNGQLFIAWTGNGANQLNVAVVDTDLSQGVALGLSSKIVLSETSSAGPSLAALNGYPFLSWKGSGNDNLNLVVSLNNAAGFTGKMVSGETSPKATTMAANDGGLFIAWKGDGNDNLNVAPVTLTGFTEAAYINQTSDKHRKFPGESGRHHVVRSELHRQYGGCDQLRQPDNEREVQRDCGAARRSDLLRRNGGMDYGSARWRDSDVVAAPVHHHQLCRRVRLRHHRKAGGKPEERRHGEHHQREKDAHIHNGGRRCGDHQLHRLEARSSEKQVPETKVTTSRL